MLAQYNCGVRVVYINTIRSKPCSCKVNTYISISISHKNSAFENLTGSSYLYTNHKAQPPTMSEEVRSCCLTGFQWSGTPTGHVGKLAGNQTYITGTNKHAAILLIHDAFGWEFPNVRLLADHFAREADATVYVPDFFGGEQLPCK